MPSHGTRCFGLLRFQDLRRVACDLVKLFFDDTQQVFLQLVDVGYSFNDRAVLTAEAGLHSDHDR